MIALPQDPVPIRPINIYVSRETAFDFEKMTRITAQALGRLGCPGCHSGRILHYQILEDFIVNPRTLELEDVVAGGVRG